MSKKIKIDILCSNIAPLENLQYSYSANCLKTAIFANNGSGKTFISRLFRLMENNTPIYLDDKGNSPTDSLLRFNSTKGLFSFKITAPDDTVKEDFSLALHQKQIPTIPQTSYIYHTFNQDYVDENIRTLGFEKDSEIQGYILGKSHIDLASDKARLQDIDDKGKELRVKLQDIIKTFLDKNINAIRDIKRLQEYKQYLSVDTILDSPTKCSKVEVDKNLSDNVDDYNKIKSTPDNLIDIKSIDTTESDFRPTLTNMIENLGKVFSISSFAEDFKQKVKNRQDFIELGLRYKEEENGLCPFCGQKFEKESLSLIDKYTHYLADEEAKAIKLFQVYKNNIEAERKRLKSLQVQSVKAINFFDEYKQKYIPSFEKENLQEIEIKSLEEDLDNLSEHLKNKVDNLSIKINLGTEFISQIDEHYSQLEKIIKDNNKKIDEINARKNKIGEESKSIRRKICKSAYNKLLDIISGDLNSLLSLREAYKKLNIEIQKKEESEKISKKKTVYETIKKVLDYFFAGKYSLDEDSFRLIFEKKSLEKGQVKRVLSEGEKNIVAFAYYIGDLHLKIQREEDYNKLFFIIDDPISSMDFTYVYTLCGVIRDLRKIVNKIQYEKFIILTHNNDFMRILCSNNIVTTKILLSRGNLIAFNENFTVPYIHHLVDIYRTARKGELYSHTTANSIRHIIETLSKFQNIEISEDSISEYIKENIPNDKKSYTFINDLSHGGWRSEQEPMTNEDYQEVCEAIIKHIEKKFPKQIKYCEKCCS